MRRSMMKCLGIGVSCGAVIAGAACAFFLAGGGHERRPVPQQPADVKVPKVSVVEVLGGTAQTLADMRKGERRQEVFRFRNASTSQMVTLRNVKASCGCIVVDKAYPKDVKPGESASVPIELVGRSKSPPLKHSYSLTLVFDQIDPVQIQFGYAVIEDVGVYPEEVVRGDVYQKDELSGSILLRPLTERALQVQGWKSERGLVQIQKYASERSGVRCQYCVLPASPGKYEDVLTITTNASIDAHIKIPFKWVVVPNVTAAPKSIFLSGVSVNGAGKEFVVKSVDDKAFVIRGMDYDKEKLNVEPMAELGQEVKESRFKVRVIAAALASARFFREQVVLHTDRGDAVLTVFGNGL